MGFAEGIGRRNAVMMALAASLALGLVGCGGGGDATTGEGQEATASTQAEGTATAEPEDSGADAEAASDADAGDDATDATVTTDPNASTDPAPDGISDAEIDQYAAQYWEGNVFNMIGYVKSLFVFDENDTDHNSVSRSAGAVLIKLKDRNTGMEVTVTTITEGNDRYYSGFDVAVPQYNEHYVATDHGGDDARIQVVKNYGEAIMRESFLKTTIRALYRFKYYDNTYCPLDQYDADGITHTCITLDVTRPTNVVCAHHA